MNLFALLAAILREIFDESAYARFCARHDCARDQDSYRSFLRESEEARRKKVACC